MTDILKIIMSFSLNVPPMLQTNDGEHLFKITQNKTRGHTYKIVLNKCRLDAEKNFYSQRIVKEWNCLPANIVKAKDAITFENFLPVYMETQNSSSN